MSTKWLIVLAIIVIKEVAEIAILWRIAYKEGQRSKKFDLTNINSEYSQYMKDMKQDFNGCPSEMDSFIKKCFLLTLTWLNRKGYND